MSQPLFSWAMRHDTAKEWLSQQFSEEREWVLLRNTGVKPGMTDFPAYWVLLTATKPHQRLNMGPDIFGNFIHIQGAFCDSVGNGKIIASVIVELE